MTTYTYMTIYTHLFNERVVTLDNTEEQFVELLGVNSRESTARHF
jgi:hypothetical protein